MLNRADEDFKLPENIPLPPLVAKIPYLDSLAERQKTTSSVLDLPEIDAIDKICKKIIDEIKKIRRINSWHIQ